MNTFSQELKRTEESLENKIGNVQSQISNIKWIIGIGIAVISILLAIIAMK